MVFQKPVCNSGKIVQMPLDLVPQAVLVFNGESLRYPDQNNLKSGKVQSSEFFV